MFTLKNTKTLQRDQDAYQTDFVHQTLVYQIHNGLIKLIISYKTQKEKNNAQEGTVIQS